MYSQRILFVLSAYACHSLADQLFAGGLPGGPPEKIQDCAKGGDYAGSFGDGSGSYVDSDSVRYNVGKKCWNDYFMVETTPFDGPWYHIGGEIFCTGTDNCVSGITKSKSTCFTSTDQISTSIGIEAIGKAVGLNFGAEYTHSWSEENCSSEERTDQCTWTDQGCHTIWGQDAMVKQRGYKRERCNTGGGDFTNCMSDWETTFPANSVNYGCGSKCGDTNSCGNNDGTPCPSKRTMPRTLKA